MTNPKIIKVSRVVGAKELVPVVMDVTPDQIEKISTGILFDIAEGRLLWLTEGAWVILQVKEAPK